jgi:hypothetical protein
MGLLKGHKRGEILVPFGYILVPAEAQGVQSSDALLG